MEISDIKQQLTLARVLQHYGLKPDKNLRLHCPFHNDKTPSLQVYYKTQTCYCFSSNCKTHGRSIDVIDFVMHKENTDKHHALLKCTEIIGYYQGKVNHLHQVPQPSEPSRIAVQNQLSRSAFLQNMFTYFKNAVHNSKPAKAYIQSRQLDFKKTEVGYNAGQFHHGARKDATLIQQCVAYGLLLEAGLTARSGDAAYKPFGKWCICFALRNEQNEIVSLYFRSTAPSGSPKGRGSQAARHFYLKDRQGLYPGYPDPATTKLILTESIIDAATLLEQDSIRSNYAVLALFGTNGLTEEHQVAIREWVIPSPGGRVREGLEIIFFLDGDEPGEKAVAKYAPMLKAAYPNVKITNVEVPQGEDINSLLIGHSPELLTHLVDTRKEFEFISPLAPEGGTKTNGETFSFSPEAPQGAEESGAKLFIAAEMPTPAALPDNPIHPGLDSNNPYNLQYRGGEALYSIKGFRTDQLDSLKITLQIIVQ